MLYTGGFEHGRVLEKCGFQTFFTGRDAYHDGIYEISKGVWKKPSGNQL